MNRDGLTTQEKISIVTGKGAWATREVLGKWKGIRMNDGPHGLRVANSESIGENNDSKPATCFPTASAIACSWDREAVARMARAIAEEAAWEGVDLVLGPGINIKRSPLCGRNFEYYSEDPYLAGELGSAYVQAMQELGIGTSLKHFAGNSQETRRMTSNSQIDERALREIYLAAFEKVVKEAKPLSIMASYNRLNGQYACCNHELLTEILRDEWGYEGTVISDWGACNDLAEAVEAGMDLEMPDSGKNHLPKLAAALETGSLSESALNRAADKVTRLERWAEENQNRRHAIPAGEAHSLVARELAAESAVLLENNGILPLQTDMKNLVLVGGLAENTRYQGGGSSHINATKQPNIVKAFQNKGMDVLYQPGYGIFTEQPDAQLESEALRAITADSVVVFVGGLTEHFEGEGYDRTTLRIPDNQIRLMNKILATGAKVVFVGLGGSPAEYDFTRKPDAILQMYLGGQEVDEACVDLLFGIANPCGKLAESFPEKLSDVACCEHFGQKQDDVQYRESLFVGYRYYHTFHIPVRYCFGHGLSYTQYAYSNLQVAKNDTGEWTVTFTVKNTGSVAGREIAQVYIQNPASGGLRAARELRGFEKVLLQSGEEQTLTIVLPERSFAIYDVADRDFKTVGGIYEILIGASLEDIRLRHTVTVEGDAQLADAPECYTISAVQKAGSLRVSEADFAVLYGREFSRLDDRRPGEFDVCNSLEDLCPYSGTARFLRFVAKMLTRITYRKKPSDDPEVMMFYRGIMEGTLDCIVCQSDGLIPYSMIERIVKQANRGGKKHE